MTTSVNLANAILKLVAADVLPAVLRQLVVGNLVQRDYEPMVSYAGDGVNIPIPRPGKPIPGNAHIVLNSHAEATFEVPDVTKALAFPELLRSYLLPAATKISSQIESDLLTLDFPTTIKPGEGKMTDVAIDYAEEYLFRADLPSRAHSFLNAHRFLVVDAASYWAIRQIPRFSEYYSAGEAGLRALVEGNVGKIRNVFVFRSMHVPVNGGFAHNLLFTREAMVLAIRRVPMPLQGTGAIGEYAEIGNFGLRVVMSYNSNTLAQQFTIDVLYGYAAARREWGVRIRTKV